jgi:signal transduction histidine kinase
MFWPPTLIAADGSLPPFDTAAAEKAASRRKMLPAWPHSLANRTLLTLLLGLVVVQAAGLTIHAFDRIELQRFAELREIGIRAMSIYRSVVATSVGERQTALREMELGPGVSATLTDSPPPVPELTPPPYTGQIRVNMGLVPVRPGNRPREVQIRGTPWSETIVMAMQFPDQGWLVLRVPVPRPRPWHSPTFLLAFVLMTVAAAVLSFWAVQRLTRPVSLLAEAAERLGRDVNAPPLPETGPDEVIRAAVAFNTMAARIRRFVQDRTFLISAIGHDLRTPITRLKLRAEFIDDDEQRQKFMADLDELDAMVSATLVFGRDTADTEPAVAFDLVALLRTVLDDCADARPDCAEALSFTGPSHLTITGRILALKRSFANLVSNAVKYGDAARVTLAVADGQAVVTVEDDGPGLPPDELERIFEPFYRVEDSRNRETGGTGLGLPIARNILRAHGGDVVLGNRAGGGARALVTLPA